MTFTAMNIEQDDECCDNIVEEVKESNGRAD